MTRSRSCVVQLGAAGLLLLGFQAACGEQGASAPPDGMRVAVAPLTLPGVGRACYDLRVTNGVDGGGEVVWSRGTPGLNGGLGDAGALCSDVYGNAGGGDITYIGPCDADGQLDGDAAGERMNSVTIWLDGLYSTGGSYLDPDGAAGWQNPCDTPTGCTLDVLCEENADALVEFNLTIMRDADQGFFDIAVNFEDIFCSAKLDTCYPEGEPGTGDDRPISLLFGGDQVRDRTAVVGFACTAGTDASTELFYGNILVDCGDETFTVDPKAGPGETSTTGSGGATLHYGVYRGAEQLDCGTGPGSCQKRYWNLALSLDDLAGLGGDCSVTLSATAADAGAFTSGLPSGAGLSYPYVDIDAQLTTGGVATCQQNPLNGEGSAVTTGYKGTIGGLPAPVVMCSTFDGTTATSTGAASCGPGGPAPSCSDNIQNQGEEGIDCGEPCEPCVPASPLLDCDNQTVDTTGLTAFEFTASLNDGTNVAGWYAFSATSAQSFVTPGFPDEISYFWTTPGDFLIYTRLTNGGTTACYELDPNTPYPTIYVTNDAIYDSNPPSDGYSLSDITMRPTGSGAVGPNIQPAFNLSDPTGAAIPTDDGLALPLTPYAPSLFAGNFFTLGGDATGTLLTLTLP